MIQADVVAEMGLYGFHLGIKEDGQIISSYESRYDSVALIRNKYIGTNECGLFRSGGILDILAVDEFEE